MAFDIMDPSTWNFGMTEDVGGAGSGFGQTPMTGGGIPVDYSSSPTGSPTTGSTLGDIFKQAQSIPGGTSILSRILSGQGTEADMTSTIGRLLATGLGMYGANQQANSLQQLAQQYQNFGAPSRARFNASMSPGFDPMMIPGYSEAIEDSMNQAMASLSVENGSPFGNPQGVIKANRKVVSGTAMPAINEYQRLNANTGFGNSMNAALGLQSSAIGANANGLNALGYGINALTNPQPSIEELLRQIQGTGYKLNSGTGL
jgi:hypothetical protein